MTIAGNQAQALDLARVLNYLRTMKRMLVGLLLVILSANPAPAATPSADEVMTAARKQAAEGKKAIFLHFGASWCVWCHRLDAFLDRPEVKPVIARYFVPVKLVVQEQAANKALENAGADALLAQLGGPAGLPYFALLDAKGGEISNSKMPPATAGPAQNIGFPSEPAEVTWFLKKLREAAPGMTDAEARVIEQGLAAKPK